MSTHREKAYGSEDRPTSREPRISQCSWVEEASRDLCKISSMIASLGDDNICRQPYIATYSEF